ncbi:MAG: hypothetical protein ACI8QD_001852 [Cyclobacteriaceae bacterium]|jgi:hypothetical protein
MKKLFISSFLAALFLVADAVPLTLINTRLKSIYLEIPGVMNPNLSPLSLSGVNLAVGQEIYTIYQKKRIQLLSIDTTYYANQEVNIHELIKENKKQLNHQK